ncbi:MAG: sulfatase-like hydrolase/transferase [Thermoplasmata archaeon]|nr:sulfatase-like hydrolase/transferase [Thermoplasmata archaeon]
MEDSGQPMVPGHPPNVLIVVLDCVRASDFPGGADPVSPMPFVQELLRDAVEFPLAASVAHWTVPAHATLFTGRYPWEHQVHARGQLHLDPALPKVGGLLRSAGYRTLSVSANGLISPNLGLVDGFQQAAWGTTLFDRVSRARSPPQSLEGRPNRAAALESRVRGLHGAAQWTGVFLARYPGVWDVGTRVALHMRAGDEPLRPAMASWLEPTLDRWLSETPPSEPVFCFINLLDAHEPYLRDAEGLPSIRDFWAYVRSRQDRMGWVSGDWNPSPAEYARLHHLYRCTVQGLDRRLGQIISAFRSAGRWDDTLMILTSDHGQAFGEHGALFHIQGVDEAELRIPLIYRPPGGGTGRVRGSGWASLIDLGPTALCAAGLPSDALGGVGVPLEDLIDRPRTGPVLAFSDGLVHAEDRRRAPLLRRESIDRLLVAAYEGERKLVYDVATDTARVYDVGRDPSESVDLWSSESEGSAGLLKATRTAAARMASGTTIAPSADVEDRLRSWGYL